MFSNNNENKTAVLAPELLFRNLYSRLCDFANQLIKDGELAEDIVQDAFMVYLERQHEISDHYNAVKSFLYTTVKNACLNKMRHHQVVEMYNRKYPLAAYTEPKILDSIIHSEIVAEIYEKINALPKGCAMVIRYGFLDGLSNSEIAVSMNISINTVKSQKRRALDLLKLHLRNAAVALFVVIGVNN